MLKGVLRYLGIDEESRRRRAEMARNLEHVDSQLDHLQLKLEEHSRIRAVEKQELDKTLSESNFGGKRKRVVRA